MLTFWLRNLILWGCRLVGIIYSVLRREVVLHLIIFVAIAIGLWLVDKIGAESAQRSETTMPTASSPPSSAGKTPARSNGAAPTERDQKDKQAQPAPQEAEKDAALSKRLQGDKQSGKPSPESTGQNVPKAAEQGAGQPFQMASAVLPTTAVPQERLADERMSKPESAAQPKGESSKQSEKAGDQTYKQAQLVPAPAGTSTSDSSGAGQIVSKSSATDPKADIQKQGKETGGQAEKKPWLWKVLSVWAFGLVVWWVVRARRRLVISKFEDFSDKKAGIDAGGFGILVATELGRLSDLLSEFEEGQNIQSTPEKLTPSLNAMVQAKKHAPLNAMFQTESAVGFLQNAISTETKFSLGPLQIPVGIILNLVGQLVQGPLLTGQIHLDGGQRIITIRLAGSLGNRAWSIIDQATVFQADKVTWRPTTEVAHNLACRLYAELAMGGSVTWEALSQFVAGVRAYRRSLQTPQRRKLNLKEAEHRLIQAHAEDPNFDLAYYNLGVVYNEQQLDAAETAFTRAIEKNNQRLSTYYALAVVNNRLAQSAFQRQEHEAAKLYHSRALDLCDQALNLSPSFEEAANILSVKAIVHWWRGFRMWPDQPMNQYREFHAAGKMARRAIWKAWEALCRAELGFGMSDREKQSVLNRARNVASRHLQSWADILLEIARIQTLLPPRPEAVKIAQEGEKIRSKLQNLEGQSGFCIMFVKAPFRFALWMYEISLALTRFSIIRKISLRNATYVLRQAASLTPAEPSVYLDLGKAYLQRERWKEAIVPLRTAARLAPESSAPWGFLALAYARLDRRDQADEASKRLLANVSDESQESLEALAQAMDALKELYAQIQEHAAAIPQRKQTMGDSHFQRWSRRRSLWLCRRLAGHDRHGFKGAIVEFNALLRQPDRLREIIHSFENARKRIIELKQFADNIKTLSAKGDEGTAVLKALFEEKKSLGHNWEVGEIGHRLTNLYLSLDKVAEAESCLRLTIAYLEESIHGEIQRRGLHALLAKILRRQRKYLPALEEAKKGVALNPVDTYERIELGWAYWDLAEYASAQSVWEDALLLAPEDPKLYLNIGLVHLQQMEDTKDRAGRLARLESATRHLNTALELFKDGDPARNSACFLLSRVYAYAGRHADAVRELRALDRIDYCDLAVAIRLADAYLESDNWAEAEHRFQQTAIDLDKLLKTAKDGPNEIVETPRGDDEMLLGTASAYAHLGIASSLAEREIFLDRALAEVEKARDTLEEVNRAELKEYWTGRCTFFEGLILSKQGKIDEAIRKLETALAASPDAATYFALANALVRKAELTSEPINKTELVSRAIRYYQETQRLDWNGALEEKISKALAQVAATK